MAMTVETAQLNNQRILQSFGLGEEIDAQAFLIKPGEEFTYTAYSGGIIEFDADGRDDHNLSKSYDLEDGQRYEFQDNTYTTGNPYDIDLYRVS